MREILYEIFGFRFLPYKTYEFGKEHVPPGGNPPPTIKQVNLFYARLTVEQIPLFVIVRLYTPIGKSQYNFLIITEALSYFVKFYVFLFP